MERRRPGWKEKLNTHLYIVVGSLVAAFGLSFFVNPGKIAAGGVSGIGTILFHTLGFDLGLSIFCLSVPLFAAGIAVFGKEFGFKSILGTVCLSGFTSLLTGVLGKEGFIQYNNGPIAILLCAIFGGVFTGAGMGMVMRSGANTGGTDILAQIISKYTPISLGVSLTLVDGIIIFTSIFFFGITSALYAIMTVYITGRLIDKVVLSFGKNYAKTVLIICNDNREAIQKGILEELGHGGTILEGTGMFSGDDRPVIMTVVKNNKINALIRIVHNSDPSAFMVVSDAYNVLGKGFRPISPTGLE